MGSPILIEFSAAQSEGVGVEVEVEGQSASAPPQRSVNPAFDNTKLLSYPPSRQLAVHLAEVLG